MLTAAFITLSLLLAGILLYERSIHRSEFGRLEEAIRKQDRRLLGSEDYACAPSHIRSLERAIFDQLFTTANLEETIIRREKLLSSLVDGLGDAVIVTDTKSHIRFANERARSLFMLRSDVIGTPFRHAVSNDKLLQWLMNCTERATSTQMPLALSGRLLDGGNDRSFDIDIAPLQVNDLGGSDVSRIVFHDVTEREELERVRKDFVANASHELRTPLTIINGYLENLIDDGAADEPEIRNRFLKVMQKHGKRLGLLVEDMLTISKLESEEREMFEMQEFDLTACVREVTDRLTPMIEDRCAEVIIDIPQSEARITGDPLYWDQILSNLLENALKENDQKGLRITITRKDTAESIEISVSDNGVGIPKNALPFIFKRFYRVDESHASEKNGTGLGLSIVKRAVEAQGGTIEASSIPGTATTFLIRLPSQRA